MTDFYVGEINLFAGNFVPRGWLACDGQTILRADHAMLFAVIGTTYGGKGTTMFSLPDLRGRVVVGAGTGPHLHPRKAGDTGGAESETLDWSQMPAHDHEFQCKGGSGDQPSPKGNVYAGGGNRFHMHGSAPMSSSVLGGAGQGKAHENMQPYMALRYIMCNSGLFPG